MGFTLVFGGGALREGQVRPGWTTGERAPTLVRGMTAVNILHNIKWRVSGLRWRA
ncbi:hypothetical protein GCM10017567_46480 [Amycolatopsis bullii]|uniref:Transposase n=1 Tax=Amycolatopsis bullii TaxID=941987 RepID=A0ABQ3KH77_9PSEU|nr:hypothetical protein GCM10017567_46480 [Amycolatopsis bullii]